MKSANMLRALACLAAVSFAMALLLSACSSTDEHPSGSSEHPTHEHPTTNAPAKNP